MQEFFFPITVAVIGVSSKPTNLGRNIVANLVEYGFTGIVYAVGPSGGMIETRRIYHSVIDIPDHVDLAVIFTPAQTVPSVLEECGQKGVRWVIIETAGFREYTQQGQQLEDEIQRITQRYGIRFIGPNCIGIINMSNGFCVPFPRLKKFVKSGSVSMITQSGGVGMSVLNLMANEGLGLEKFVSVGNKLDVSSEDMLEYLVTDEDTDLIFMYLESIGDGRRMMQLARQSPKPVLVFKSNIGRLGQKIALSHTASLASDDRVVDSAFHQAGILRVRDATALGNNLKILRLPAMRGRRLGVISRSGGHAVIAADACELSGFELAPYPDHFLREIERHFRASVIRLTNPLDLGDLFDLDVYAQIVEGTLQLPEVDGVVFLHTAISEAENMTSRRLLERLIGLVAEYNKPIAYYISTSAAEVSYLKQTYDFPIFTQVVETVRALEMSHYYHGRKQAIAVTQEVQATSLDAGKISTILDKTQLEGRDPFLDESMHILQACGLPVLPFEFVTTSAQASEAAQTLGFPVAMKVVARSISHKSDVGGVVLNLVDRRAVEQAFSELQARLSVSDPQVGWRGIVIQPMAKPGQELIIGGRQDPQFGPVILVGLGGIFVEVFEDFAMRVAPLSERDADEMLQSLRGYPLLSGARGRVPLDLPALRRAICQVGDLLVQFPQIKELDINPLRAFDSGSGIAALDARIAL